MKISKVAGPLALAALFAAPASAQLDMSAAKGLLESIRAVKTGQPATPKKAPAPAAAPAASEADWKKILELVKAKGKYKPEDLPATPGMFTLEERTGPEDGNYVMRSVSVLGVLNEQDLFEAVAAVLVTARFDKKADGTWAVDEWMFQTDVYGEVGTAVHIVGVLDAAKNPVSGGPEKISTTDPRIAANFTQAVAHWSAQKP